MNSVVLSPKFGARGGISMDDFVKVSVGRCDGKLDSFVFKNLLSLLWLLSLDEGLL